MNENRIYAVLLEVPVEPNNAHPVIWDWDDLVGLGTKCIYASPLQSPNILMTPAERLEEVTKEGEQYDKSAKVTYNSKVLHDDPSYEKLHPASTQVTCFNCGAVVDNRVDHDLWHRSLSKALQGATPPF
jgi:hypothetical protein